MTHSPFANASCSSTPGCSEGCSLRPAHYAGTSGGRTRGRWCNDRIFRVTSERRGRLMRHASSGRTRVGEAGQRKGNLRSPRGLRRFFPGWAAALCGGLRRRKTPANPKKTSPEAWQVALCLGTARRYIFPRAEPGGTGDPCPSQNVPLARPVPR